MSTSRGNTTKNYYDILGVESNATTAQIKKAFHTLALKYHPDKSKADNSAQFLLIYEAYEVLIDTTKRNQYDRSLGVTTEGRHSAAASNAYQTSEHSPSSEALSKIDAMIRAYADEDPVFSVVLTFSGIRNRIIDTLLPQIMQRLFLKEQDQVTEELRFCLDQNTQEILRAKKLYALLHLLATRHDDLSPKEKDLISRVTKYRDLDKSLEYLRSQINEGLNWIEPLQFLLMDLEFSNNKDKLDVRRSEKQDEIKSLLERDAYVSRLSSDEFELFLLLVIPADSAKKLSEKQWKNILNSDYYFSTEFGIEHHAQPYTKAKKEFTRCISLRLRWRYYYHLGIKLRKGVLSPLEFIASLGATNLDADSRFLYYTLYNGYVDCGESTGCGSSPFEFDCTKQFPACYDDDNYIYVIELKNMWSELISIAKDTNKYSDAEQGSIKSLAKNIIQLFKSGDDLAGQYYNFACLIKTHADGLMKHHRQKSKLGIFSCFNAPPLIGRYNAMIKRANRYWEKPRLKSLGELSPQLALQHTTIGMTCMVEDNKSQAAKV